MGSAKKYLGNMIKICGKKCEEFMKKYVENMKRHVENTWKIYAIEKNVELSHSK